MCNVEKYITETFLEYPNNCDIATIFYFCGCDRKCFGCHNSDLQNYQEFNADEVIIEIKKRCARLNTNKVVLCGGDPLYYKNIDLTKQILQELKDKYEICIYTGAEIEGVKQLKINGFKFLKCGKFDKDKFVGATKTDNFIRFATTNQELYDKDLNLISKNGIYYFSEG